MEAEVEIPRAILLQLQQVRDDGRTNMLDRNGVQWVANDLDCYDLVEWIEVLDDLPRQERPRKFMAALNAMGKLPSGAWEEETE